MKATDAQFARFHARKIPKGISSDTEMAVYSIVSPKTGDFPTTVLSYMRWGLPILQDIVTFVLFSRFKQNGHNDEVSLGQARGPVSRVDWELVDSLMSMEVAAYRKYCREVSHDEDKIETAMQELKLSTIYQRTLPGVDWPGDLYKKVAAN